MYCFILYSFIDFDGDGFIGASDIENAVKLLTQDELNHDEIESVWEKVSSSLHMFVSFDTIF